MKYFLACLIAMPVASMAQSNLPKDVYKAEQLINQRGRHSIHRVESVELKEYVVNEKKCANNPDADPSNGCPDGDFILSESYAVIQVNTIVERNLCLDDGILIQDLILEDSYNSEDEKTTTTQISLKGFQKLKDSTVVYEEVACAAWGGESRLSFKIKVSGGVSLDDGGDRDLSKNFVYVIPLSRFSSAQFKTEFSGTDWIVSEVEVKNLEKVVSSELTAMFFDEIQDSGPSGMILSSLSCYIPDVFQDAQTAICYNIDFRKVTALSEELSRQIVLEYGTDYKFRSREVNFRIECSKPNEYNKIEKDECKLSIKR